MGRDVLERRATLGTLACALILVVIATTGCGTVGATAISGGRERYQDAIRRTGEEQMLLNLVRLQYDDIPYFLQVSTIVSSMTAGLNLRVSPTFASPNSVGLDFLGTLTDNPSVTYQPLQGKDFFGALFRRIPDDTIVSLYRGGWNIYEILMLAVHDLGALHNLATQSLNGIAPAKIDGNAVLRREVKEDREQRGKVDAEAFEDALTILYRLFSRGVVDLDLEPPPPDVQRNLNQFLKPSNKKGDEDNGKDKDGKDTGGDKKKEEKPERQDWPVLRLLPRDWTQDSKEWCDLMRMLQVQCSRAPSLCTGTVDTGTPATPGCAENGLDTVYFFSPTHLHDPRLQGFLHIPLTMRTLLEVMTMLSGGVATPEGRAHDRRTARCDDTPANELKWHGAHPFFRVRCSRWPPRNYSVRVWYRGNWFFIKEDDPNSRRVFTMLLILFQQQLGNAIQPLGPTLTLPVNR